MKNKKFIGLLSFILSSGIITSSFTSVLADNLQPSSVVMDTSNADNMNTINIRISIASLFDTKPDANYQFHGMLSEDSEGNTVDNPTLFTGYKNVNVVNRLFTIQNELGVMASFAFSDVTSNDWYTPHLALPIYYNVLSGYDDNTLRPYNYITPSEVAKVISATFEGDLGNGEVWYNTYFKNVGKAFTYDAYSKMGTNHADYMEGYNMKRCEIAYVIAKYVDGNSGELDGYITSAKAGNLGSLQAFSDCRNLATDDDGTYDNDMRIMSAGWIPSRYAGSLAYLVDKGVFEGDDQGNMNPLEPVTRAEVFALLNRMCNVTEKYVASMYEVSDASLEVSVPEVPDQSTPTTEPEWWGGDSYIPGSDDPNDSYKGGGQPYEVWASRPNMTLNANDPYRDRAKAGDTFIALDGTTYVLEAGIGGVVGQGLPIALDLGRTDSWGVSVTNNFQTSNNEFGWITDDVNTSGCTYYVYKTGEGHWDTEWVSIQNATQPQYEGTNGEWSADGYWYWNDTVKLWRFAPLISAYQLN